MSYAHTLGRDAFWVELDTVTLTNKQQPYVELSEPLPSSRFYRAWQTKVPSVMPKLQASLATEITLTGDVGDRVRVDYINQFDPTYT